MPMPMISGEIATVNSVPAALTVPATSSENVKHVPYSSILTSPNRLKDVMAKLAAPIPVGKLKFTCLYIFHGEKAHFYKIHKMFYKKLTLKSYNILLDIHNVFIFRTKAEEGYENRETAFRKNT